MWGQIKQMKPKTVEISTMCKPLKTSPNHSKLLQTTQNYSKPLETSPKETIFRGFSKKPFYTHL